MSSIERFVTKGAVEGVKPHVHASNNGPVPIGKLEPPPRLDPYPWPTKAYVKRLALKKKRRERNAEIRAAYRGVAYFGVGR